MPITATHNTIVHKNLLQEEFLNRILQQLELNSDISKYLFKLRYNPEIRSQGLNLMRIARIIINDYQIYFEEAGINEFAARVNKRILEVFKQEMENDGIDVDLNQGRRRNPSFEVTYQWLWNKKFSRMGLQLAKQVAVPAFEEFKMIDEETMQRLNIDVTCPRNLNITRGLDFEKIPKYDGSCIQINKPHWLLMNLPIQNKYLLLINESLEEFYLLSPSKAFANVPYTRLSEGSYLLPPNDERGGRASCFQYDAVGEEYFLAIVTDNPIELSWVCDATPRDIILNQERVEKIFIKLSQESNIQIFYKRFKVMK